MKWICILFTFISYISANLSQYDCLIQKPAKVIKINNSNYLMYHLKTYNGPSPKQLLYVNGKIFYKIGNFTYEYEKNKKRDKSIQYEVLMNPKESYVDNFGNRVISKNRNTYVYDYKYNKKFKIVTDSCIETDYLTVDTDKNRIYLIGYDKIDQESGNLYSFETTNLTLVGGVLIVEKVHNVGDNISAITIDLHSGNLAIIMIEHGNKWSLNIMKNINSLVCKLPRPFGVYKNYLKTAIQLAGEEMFELYQNAVFRTEASGKSTEIKNILITNKITKPTTTTTTTTPFPFSVEDTEDDHNCATRYGKMVDEIEKLKLEMENMKEKYIDLYDRVVQSDILTTLESFNKKINKAHLKPLLNIGNNDVICYKYEDIKIITNNLNEAKDTLKKSIDWFQPNNENSNNIEEDESEFSLDVRFDKIFED